MATTYAAMISLMNTLTRYQHPTCPVSFDQSQLSSLLDKVSSLVDLLEAHSHKMSQDLLTNMADAAFKVEDTIESYYVDKVLEMYQGGAGKDYGCFCQDMEEAVCLMDVILRKSMEVAEQNHGKVHVQPERSVSVRGGSVLAPDEKVKMVGLDQELLRLVEQLSSDKSSRQIIPVVGMGGIGKTTLARNVFDHAYVKYHFHIKKWVTVSQGYTVHNILASLLETDGKSKSTEELGEQLYKSLSGRKYFVILDDIWDDSAWNEIRRFFPDNNNGSRILLTTRNLNVGLIVGSCKPHEVKLLGHDESLELLSQIIFRQEVCPLELVECGNKIARGCRGLPLAITTVGGLLKMSNGTLAFWKNVAENVSSFISVQNESHCLEILSLSYNHLPIYLKPCFLYLATFKEDEKVEALKLIRLWVANGFLKPSKDQILEEVGFEYLNNLVDRNLIMVTHHWKTGRIESLSFHDLLREFCLREAADSRFLYEVKKDLLHVPEVLDSTERHLVCHFHSSEINLFPSVPFVRSSTNHAREYGPLDLTFYKLLRVLRTNSSQSLRSQTPLVNFRYLSYNYKKNSVPGFFAAPFLVWNLETLELSGVFDDVITLPFVFWELPNLRHLFSLSATILLPDPTNVKAKCVLNNLQSLSNIQNFNLTNEVLEKIPEVRRLEITYDGDFCSENSEKLANYITNLARLRNLETLHIYFFGGGCLEDLCVFKEKDILAFSPKFRELRLWGCYIPWENMSVIGSLPNLQVLFLLENAFCGEEWNSTEGEFLCLKYLEIENCGLRIWRAESSHFPRLEELRLGLFDLEEIPLGIADILSLEKIELWTLYLSAVKSAKEILDERENQGNDGLSIQVEYIGKREEEEEVLNLASHNFQVTFLLKAQDTSLF